MISFPKAALSQHIAILGKTGSGKTTTAKLAIEQVVAEGARVCILDPIKSDWWGLTSSADGKRPGLPFHILGGPRGHVPLHQSAGKAIAEIVATGALPLSILDMADFAPGGQAHFFVDFAPALMRKMRGVLYLVIEEAHLFAPKERSGVGKENMSIHWAKTLATAGRTKGIRLIVVTQRTQALHNAVLGSCDTMVVHRMTAPADQKPVIDWLKANVKEREVRAEVENSLSSLGTGTGWLCSGEAKLFELMTFPRAATFDNTATPSGDGTLQDIKTAPIDAAKLRAIVDDAVKEAEDNDPAKLKARIAELERAIQIAKPAVALLIKPPVDEKAIEQRGYNRGADAAAKSAIEAFSGHHRNFVGAIKSVLDAHANLPNFDVAGVVPVPISPAPRAVALQDIPSARELLRGAQHQPIGDVSKSQQKILDQLAWLESIGLYPSPKATLAAVCGVSLTSSTYDNNLGALRTAGYLAKATGDGMASFTDEGRAIAAQAPRNGRAIHEHWLDLVRGSQRAILQALINHHPNQVGKQLLADQLNVSASSSTYQNNLGRLRTLGAIDYPAPGKVQLTKYVMP